MASGKFVKSSTKYQRELKKYLEKNFGKRCGHISKNSISLDCIVCKAWLAYEFLAWLNDTIGDLEK